MILAGRATAQTFTNLHIFTAANFNSSFVYTNSDGVNPWGRIISGNTLYGTTDNGGSDGNGTLVKVNTDGTGFTILHSFTGGSDGAFPIGLILSGNTLYGTAYDGGAGGNGTVFSLNTNGTGFATLHNFSASALNALGVYTNSDGVNPRNTIYLLGNTLYGTTTSGGSGGSGTLFAVNTNGTSFTIFHSFSAKVTNALGVYTNSDGIEPFGYFLLGNTLYGTTYSGGSGGSGTLFKINTNGTGFTILHSFTTGSGYYPNVTNSDGALPEFIRLSGNTLYVTTEYGGSGGKGTLCKINTNGTGFLTLHTFASGSGSLPNSVTNTDGAVPLSLIVTNNTLYGVAQYGGSGGNGTVFSLNTNGTGFTNLHIFASGSGFYPNIINSDGIRPHFLILSSNILYGLAENGGSGGNGTVFSLNTNGTGFTTLHSFASGSSPYNGVTNSDGAQPNTFTLASNTLYGTTYTGGSGGNGTVFSLSLGSVSAGSLQVNLAPAGAVSAGAQWQVDGSAWQINGATVSGLSVGSHTIAFNSISGWATPTNQTAIIIANQTTTATGTYIPITNTGSNEVLSLVGGGYVTIPNSPDLQNSNQITVEAWIYPANSNAMWLSKGDGADCCSARSYDWHWNGSEVDIAMFWASTNKIDGAISLSVSNWVHIAAVYSSQPGLYQVYTNGILAVSRTTDDNGALLAGLPLRSSTRPLTFGQDPYWLTAVAKGFMDEVRIWNMARTAQQIKQNMSCKLSGLESNLVAYWNYDGGTMTDQTGRGHNGTLMGTASIIQIQDVVHQGNCGIDTNKPTSVITSPTSGQRWSNPAFNMTGTAGDNVQVFNVWCQINGSGWNLAATANNWSNWTATVNLIAGTNTVQAYAMDTSGNISATNSVSLQYVVTNLLAVQAVGLGTISPNYSNSWLEIGRNYSMTATPGTGFVVTNWTISTNWLGGRITNNATVQFMMASNLTLQINFADVTKPTNTITSPTVGQHMTNALATIVGTASDNWKVAGVWYQLNSNVWSLMTTTNSYTNWTKTVTLLVGTNTIKTYALDLGGNFSATNNLNVVSSNTFKLQLAFTNSQPLKTNGLVFSLQLSTGLNGLIQVSSNLINWVTLTNFVGTNTTLIFRDPAATNSNRRFYRAVIP